MHSDFSADREEPVFSTLLARQIVSSRRAAPSAKCLPVECHERSSITAVEEALAGLSEIDNVIVRVCLPSNISTSRVEHQIRNTERYEKHERHPSVDRRAVSLRPRIWG